jgi:leader peptidase (prepilin peptidase)/N-methyltransferase
VLGWLVGLAMNCVIHAVPRDRPPISRVRCEECGAPASLLDPRPRQRCPGCGNPLAQDRVELLLAALFVVLANHFGLSGPLVAYSAYTVVLVSVAVVDLRHRFIYTIMTLPGLLGALWLTPVLTDVSVGATAAGIVVGASIFGLFYLVGHWVYPSREALGKGDIEVAALAGAMVGFPRIVVALFLGSVVNAVIILLLLASRRRSRRDFVPYAPGLCVGIFAAFFLPA